MPRLSRVLQGTPRTSPDSSRVCVCVCVCERQAFQITEEVLVKFRETWSHFDPNATHFVSSDQLLDLVQAVEYPLGLKNKRTARAMPCR